MLRDVKAAFSYFAIVFVLGFLFGTLRVLIVAPLLGEGLAVLIETPIMLVASWVASGWIVRSLAVPRGLAPRAVMGGVAFALLMAAELGVSTLVFGRSVDQYVQTFRTAPAIIGLSAQIAFALMPLVQSYVAPRERGAA